MKISRIDIIGQNGNDAEIYHHLHKHGHRPKTGPSPTYVSWTSMKARCQDSNSENYMLYGGRGITVCDQWQEFTAFLSDMGERPEGCTLDRVDPNGNYEKGNCRWATSKDQAGNKRETIYVDFHGSRVAIRSLAEAYGVPTSTIYRRHKQGYSGADLVTRKNMNVRRTGERCPSSKLNADMVSEIKRLLLNGETIAAIRKIYPVSQPAISDIKAGRTWAHVKANELQ